MTYQELVGMIFPAYVVGCGIAVLANLPDRKSLLLAVFYSLWVIIVFQFLFWGKAQIFSWRWYLLLCLVHGITITLAQILETRATRLITILSSCVIAFNLAFLFAWFTHPLPRQLFFVGMNTLQTLSLGSLVVFGSAWPFLANLWRKLPIKRSKPPWMEMVPD